MRIPKQLYDPLKQLERQEGVTTGVDMHRIKDLISAGLVEEDIGPRNGEKTYLVYPSTAGKAALKDIPLL